VLKVENDFDNIFENVFKTELVTTLSDQYKLQTGEALPLTFSDCIKFTVKKTRWQSAGNCELRFQDGEVLGFKNKDKLTVITVPKGLPSSSRPDKKGNTFEKKLRPVSKAVDQSKKMSLFEKKKSNYAEPQRVQVSASIYTDNTLVNKLGKTAISQNSLNNSSGLSGSKYLATSGSGSNVNLAGSNSNLPSSHKNLAAVAKKKLPPPPPPKKILGLKALYAYDAAEADELSFAVGDVIELVSKDDPGWWTGKCRGRTGIFPSNYVQSD
jgi:myosin-1